jgi:peptidoglycan L-alanyl-D-glutamate endopeptidase CwlK
MPDRSIQSCVPALQTLYFKFSVAMARSGLTFMITRSRASLDEQKELWAQGRTKPGPLCRCNGKTNPIGTCKKHPFGLCVTWTLNSRHLLGEAFDIAIIKDGKPNWDAKVDVNKDNEWDYFEAAKIGKECGLECGFFWEHQDPPHYELPRVVTAAKQVKKKVK